MTTDAPTPPADPAKAEREALARDLCYMERADKNHISKEQAWNWCSSNDKAIFQARATFLCSLGWRSNAAGYSRPEARGREAALKRARITLDSAGNQFSFYATEHAKKGTPEADAKAITNSEWAHRCRIVARSLNFALAPSTHAGGELGADEVGLSEARG